VRRTLFALALAISALSLPAFAADEPVPGPWQWEGLASFNLNQSAFSNNWSGGDKGSYAWSMNLDLKAERQFTRSFNWSNVLLLAYGQTAKQEEDDQGDLKWQRPDKNTDQILFESTGRWSAKALDPYLQFRLETQFLDDSDPRGTRNLSPVRLTETGGVTKIFRKTEKEEFLTRLGFGLRQSFGSSFVTLDTDETEPFTTTDGGLEWQTIAKFPFDNERFTFSTRLLFFLPFFYSASGDLEAFDREVVESGNPDHDPIQDYWKAVDIDWQNTLTAKFSDVLSLNLFVHMVYDKFDAATDLNPDLPLDARIANAQVGIRKATQWKQTLAVSLSYRFF
jgi:hypothetical protein